MRLTLRQLEIFTAIAHTGSTTAAADNIALSQSAVSAAINELERILGIRLFDRAGKRLLLNDQGRALLPQAQALLASVASLEQGLMQGAASALRIGASLTIGNYLLPGLLAGYWRTLGIDLAHDLPKMRVSVENTALIAEQVENFELDIGLVEGVCRRPGVQATPWLEDELLIVASPTHAIIDRYGASRIPLKQLAEANWLLREPGSGTREVIEQALLPHLQQLRSSLEFSDHEAIKYAAAAGLGVACLSRLTLTDMLDSGKLVRLNSPLNSVKRRFYILTHRRKQITPGLQRLLDHLGSMA